MPLKTWPATAIIILITGVFLRLICLDAPLVSDELASVSIWAQMPIWKIPVNYQNTNNHIFNTLILGSILKVFGLNHFLLRLPLLIFSTFSLILCFSTTLKITNNKYAAIGALTLLSFNSTHILYSTYSRGYMLVMLLGQISVYLFLILLQKNRGAPFFSMDRPLRKRDLLLFGCAWFIGTWTLPTFAVFEGSLLVFFGSSLLFKHRDKIFNPSFPYTQITLTLLFCLCGFGFQYFILIPAEMLKGAFAFANESPGFWFLAEMAQLLITPLDSLVYIFILLMFVGLFSFFKKERDLFLLFFTILVFIPGSIQINNLIHLLSVNPPPRVFNYLQPFFFTCASLGAFLTVKTIFLRLKGASSQEAPPRAVYPAFFVLFAPIVFLYGVEFNNKTFPEIKARVPYQKIGEFVKQLGPKDLFLASSKNHLWFYLYGADEMRKRVYNIMDTGDLGDIYILEDIKDEESDIEMITGNDGIRYLNLKNYEFNKELSEQVPLLIPAKAVGLVKEYEYSRIYKLNPRYVEKTYELKGLNDFNIWTRPNNLNARLSPIKTPAGVRKGVSFKEPFVMFTRARDSYSDSKFRLDINFICASSQGGYEPYFFNGDVSESKVMESPTWSANLLVIDHPYGAGIIDRDWIPRIFITKPSGPFNFIQVDGRRENIKGFLRGILTFSISINESFHSEFQQSN